MYLLGVYNSVLPGTDSPLEERNSIGVNWPEGIEGSSLVISCIAVEHARGKGIVPQDSASLAQCGVKIVLSEGILAPFTNRESSRGVKEIAVLASVIICMTA